MHQTVTNKGLTRKRVNSFDVKWKIKKNIGVHIELYTLNISVMQNDIEIWFSLKCSASDLSDSSEIALLQFSHKFINKDGHFHLIFQHLTVLYKSY